MKEHLETDPHPSGWDAFIFMVLLLAGSVGLVWMTIWVMS